MSSIAGTWSQITLGGHTADIYEPRQPTDEPRAVLHLHGHGLETLKDNTAFSAELERHGLYAMCPHGQRCWWLDHICPEFDTDVSPLQFLRETVLPDMAARWNVSMPAVGLTGISMGGQGVLQLAYRFPREFPVVAAISPAVDFHNWHGAGLPLDTMFSTQEAARQETATLRLTPMNWPRHQMIVCDPADAEWFEGVDRLAMKLASMAIPFQSDFTTSHGGHCWEYFNAMARPVLQFVAEKLDAESRRLV